MLLDSFEIPLLNFPPISAKSLRIPAMTSSSAGSRSADWGGADGLGGWVGSGGGARKEATPQNWRDRVLVSSERSPLTVGVDGEPDWGSGCGSGGDEFGSVLELGFVLW